MIDEIETKKAVRSHFSGTKHEDSFAALIYIRVVIGFLQRLSQNAPELLVLDVGCGTGTLESHVPAVGIDFSTARLAVAKGCGPMECVAADANLLPFRDAKFDVVHFAATLMHVPNYKGAIREASKVLRKNGMLVIYEPNHDYAGTVSWDMQGLYFQSFSRPELERVLMSEGYKVIRSKYCLSGIPMLQGFLQRRVPWMLLLLERLSIPRFSRELFLVASKEK